MRLKEAVFAFLFFTIITLSFFYQIFFGLIPLPTDLIVGMFHPWIDYSWGNVTNIPIHNSLLSDAVSLIYPLKMAAVEFMKNGEIPLWNPYMFGGYPLFGSCILGLIFPTMIFYFLFSAPIAWTIQMISEPLLASFFMYLLLRHLKLDKLPSVFGGLTFGFGGFMSVWMQWNTQAATAMFLPVLILLEDKYLETKNIRCGALFSIFIAFQIFAGYLPVVQFTYMGLVLWFLFRSQNYRTDLKISFFVILGFALSAIFLLPVAELIQLSQRRLEALDPSEMPFISFENLLTIVIPDFFGNTATRNFWGKGNYLDTTIYTGIVALIFAISGLKNYFNKIPVKFAVSLILLSIILAFQNPLSIFLYKLGIWGGESLTLNRINFLINFSVSILAAYGLSVIKENFAKLSIKPGVWILSVVSGVVLGLLLSKLLISRFFIFPQNEIWQNYINISLRNSVPPLILSLFVIIFILTIKKFKKIRSFAEIVFIFILIFELFRFGLKFNAFSKVDYLYPKTPISNFLEKYPNDRILGQSDVFPSNMWVPYKMSSIAGYDGIYPLDVAQLLASANSDAVEVPPQARWGLLTNFNSKIVDETNTRFLIAVKREKDGTVSEKGKVDPSIIGPKYKQIFSDRGIAVFENTQSYPRVYLTKHVIKISEKQALKFMLEKDFPANEISLSDFEWNNLSTDLLEEKLDYKVISNSHVEIKSFTKGDSYMVVLDSYYPGWKALIDGEETQIHKTNYNFKGILLPKGKHVVDFIYDPESFRYGAIISGFSLLLIIVLLAAPKFKKN